MKKGYKKLLFFSFIIIVLILCNTFIINFLSGYKIVLFLTILLLIFNRVFVIEKDRHLYFKDILFEIFMFSMAFFILYYLMGLFVGLAKTANYLSFYSIKVIILPLILYCVLREVFRYNMLCKADNNKLCTILVIVLIILMDISNDYYYADFNTSYDILRFIALVFLPAISKGLSYSYISKKMGYKPVIIFDLVFSLYKYVFPLIPNPNEYIVSIICLVTPILFAFRIVKFFEVREKHKLPSDYKKLKLKGIALPLAVLLVLVYFYSGYFRYFTIAIASGSMEPMIKKGDVVIADQKFDSKKLEIGQVIAYKKNGVIIVHRIVKKIKLGDSYIYYTKGDANSNMDDFVIEEDMIVGRVNHKISYIGYPTVWFNNK